MMLFHIYDFVIHVVFYSCLLYLVILLLLITLHKVKKSACKKCNAECCAFRLSNFEDDHEQDHK